ncbi:unnamed protein product [Pleuronectes platessa]|uniref:Uncharacterized protein n=1 Tax=Pleuronectes platessa TaxID=8262 RepID=A0A9N7V8M7_PLEPL|nr:unnamed protein product [Pleuronectes platessa]
MKSTQNAAFDNTHVQAFQAAAANEISKRWEVEMAYKDAATNTSVIAAALDPRFCRLKFLSPDESLKLQVKVQALAIEAKRRMIESQQQQHTTEAQTSAGVTEKRVQLQRLISSKKVFILCWADYTTRCRAFRLKAVQLPYQAVMQPVRMLSMVHL